MSSSRTEPPSSSRLSPLAQPFFFSRSNSLHHWPQFSQHASHPVPAATSSKPGNSPTQELRLFSEISESSRRKCVGILEENVEVRSKLTQQIDVEFVPLPYISELWPNAIPKDHQTKLKFSHSSGNDFPVQVSLASCTTNDRGYLSLDLPGSIKESCTMPDKNVKEVFNEPMEVKHKDRKGGSVISSEVADSLTVCTSEMQITTPSVPHYLTLKLPGGKEDNPVEHSSKISGENDSDLDSPCWIGTNVANQSTFEYSGQENWQNLKSGQEESSHFSPLASHLFSTDDKQNINYNEVEFDGDSSSFFLNAAASASTVNISSERISTNSVVESSSSELRNGLGFCLSFDLNLPDEDQTPLKSNGGSILRLSDWLQPSNLESDCKSPCQPMNRSNVAGFVQGIKDAEHNDPNGISFASNVFSSSCRVGVQSNSDFTETHGSAPRSFSMSPRLDIHKVIITMNELSELLMQNCSNDLDSLNQHEHDIIQSIINNLTMCIRNRVGKETLMPESSHPFTSYAPKKSAGVCKSSVMEFQAARAEPKAIPHALVYKSEKQQSCSTSTNERLLHYIPPSKDERSKIRETKLAEKTLVEHYDTKDINSRVLLYKNLWLEAEAARHFIQV